MPGCARLINMGWVVFTLLCAAASVGLAALGIRESGAISPDPRSRRTLPTRIRRARGIGTRLGVSAALLLLVASSRDAFNLWSIVRSLDALRAADFLL